MQRLVLILTAGLVVLALYTFQRGGQPDPSLIHLAVRATVFAMPSPSPRIVEVTRVVEVTRMVEIVRVVEVTPTLAAPSPSPTLTPTPIAAAPSGEVVALAAVVPAAAPNLPAETFVETVAVAEPVSGGDGTCPVASGNQYTSIPVEGSLASHPDYQHGDLNLALRGYVPAEATLSLVDINGPTDGDAPQLAGVLGRLPAFGRAYRARDWNWACGALGCRGEELGNVEVSLVAMQSNPGEAVHVPTRGAEIYGGGICGAGALCGCFTAYRGLHA